MKSVFLLFHDVYGVAPAESGFRSPAADRYKLSTSRFDEHLAALARIGAAALPFTLTFDDGGESFYTIVADRLEALGWRAHCFVPTDCIGRPGFLTRQQIRELDRRGHTIGSHSASHPPRISACPRQVIECEWTESIAVLQDILGRPVVTASVPGGFYSAVVAEAAAASGVLTLFTSEPVTSLHRVAGCFVAGRFAIRESTPPDVTARLVASAPFSRWAAWASWNTKALIKPILGNAYLRAADWLMARKAVNQPLMTSQEK